MQDDLMKFDPATGEPKPYPSHAGQWRKWHGDKIAWLFDPWTGRRRDARDVGSDAAGLLIMPAGTLGGDIGGSAKKNLNIYAPDDCKGAIMDVSKISPWRDVANELPKKNQEVLFVRNGKTVHGAWIGDIFWHNNEKVAAAKWMPLPAPPNE